MGCNWFISIHVVYFASWYWIMSDNQLSWYILLLIFIACNSIGQLCQSGPSYSTVSSDNSIERFYFVKVNVSNQAVWGSGLVAVFREFRDSGTASLTNPKPWFFQEHDACCGQLYSAISWDWIQDNRITRDKPCVKRNAGKHAYKIRWDGFYRW